MQLRQKVFSSAMSAILVLGLSPMAAMAEGTEAEATNAGTIQPMADPDITEDMDDYSLTVAKGETVKLDLKGHTLRGMGDMIVNDGTLTITDSSAAKTGTIEWLPAEGGKGTAIINNADATLTIETVNMKTSVGGQNGGSLIENLGTLTIEGGTFTGGNYNIKNSGAGSKATLTIKGGTFNNPNDGKYGYRNIMLWDGTATIDGGTFDAVEWPIVIGPNADTKLNINNGTFSSSNNRPTVTRRLGNPAGTSTVVIAGGTFKQTPIDPNSSSPIASSYAEGFNLIQNADGTYSALKVSWNRLGGANRLDTMKTIVSSSKGFNTSDVAVVASAMDFPDALAASALAGKYNAPVILTEKNVLSDQAKTELERLKVKKVFIIGGTAAIADSVDTAIKAIQFDYNKIADGKAEAAKANVETVRLSGATRIETAQAIMDQIVVTQKEYNEARDKADAEEKAAQEANKTVELPPYSDPCDPKNGTYDVNAVIVATSANFADALAAGPLAYVGTPDGDDYRVAPILLTNLDGTLPDAALQAIKDGNVNTVLVVGGTAVIPNETTIKLMEVTSNVKRLAGATRYETSADIARYASSNGNGLGFSFPVVTTGKNFPDALAAAAFAGKNHSVLVLADNANDPALAKIADNKKNINLAYVVGGVNAMPDTLVDAIAKNTGIEFNKQ